MSRRGTPTPTEAMARECLANQARLIARGITGIYDEALRPLGLRVSQLAVLVAIDAAGPARPGELSRLLCMDKSTLSRNVDRLLAGGWAESVPGDDGRSHELRLTRRGRRLVARAAPAWGKAQQQIRRLLGEANTAGLSRMAAKLQAANEAQ